VLWFSCEFIPAESYITWGNQTFNLSPTLHKFSVWSPYLSVHHNLGTNVMFLFHASVHISWVLVSQLILCHNNFFFHCGESEPLAQCNTLLLWMWFWAKLNILNVFCLSKYVILNSVCLVIFLIPNVVKVCKGCSSSLFFVSIFPSILSVCTFPRSVWVIPYDFFHDI